MATVGLSEAGEALRNYLGPRLDASQGDGPDMMRDALVERFHISKDEAKKLVDDLIKADSVHWESGGERPVSREADVAGTQIGVIGLPTSSGEAVIGGPVGGYWRFK